MGSLLVEVNADFVRANDLLGIKGWAQVLVIPPPIDEGYWLFRVKLYADQAIVGFPKFNTIAIGFALEDDWNTNLPYSCDSQEIFDHIAHNRKYDDHISDARCIQAIELIQQTIQDIGDRKGL